MQLVDVMQPGGTKVNISFLDKWAPYFNSLKPLGLKLRSDDDVLRCVLRCVFRQRFFA